MNKISPKTLLHSKWTKVVVNNKEKHFLITKITVDENQSITECLMEAVINHNEYQINWRDLKNSKAWRIGWQ